MTDHRPPADGAGYAPPESSDAGSSSGAAPQGKARAAPGKVTEPEPGAAGRKAWREAISANAAAKARGRKWAKSKRTGPGMLRKPPPGDTA